MMNMSKMVLCIDDIFGDVTKRRQATLQHAAEISPYVTERTLGPDKAPWCDEVDSNDVNQNTEVEENAEENSPATEEESNENSKSPEVSTSHIVLPTPTSSSFSLQNLDFQTINTSVLVREAEQKRKQLLRQQLTDMQERHTAAMEVTAEQKRLQYEINFKETIANKLNFEHAIALEAEEQSNKEQQQYERQLETLRLQTKRQLQAISFQGISKYQGIFRVKYENVAKLLLSIDKNILPSCHEHNGKLKDLVQMFERLIGKIKSGECGQNELKMAEHLCKTLDALYDVISREIEIELQKAQQQAVEASEAAATAASEAAAAVVAEANSAAQQQQSIDEAQAAVAGATTANSPASPVPAAGAPNTTAASNVVENICPEFYKEIHAFLIEKMQKIQIMNDDSMKPYRSACQKAINIPVNAISAVSPQHLQDKFEKLYNFISGQPIRTNDGQQVSVNDHPQGRDFCLFLMAKKFVSQGETAISSNPQAAYPVASVIVSLWKHVPDFGKLFLGCIFSESPLLIPLHFKSIEYNDLKKQAGVARLYAAVMITSGRQADASAPHPYGIENCWRWIAAFTRIQPLPDISATLILEILQIVGFDMFQTYQMQFLKLLLHLQRDYMPRLAAVDEGGPRTRFEMLLSDYLAKKIMKPQNVLPNNFW